MLITVKWHGIYDLSLYGVSLNLSRCCLVLFYVFADDPKDIGLKRVYQFLRIGVTSIVDEVSLFIKRAVGLTVYHENQCPFFGNDDDMLG